MEGFLANAQWWQIALLLALYILYLVKVLGGGTKRRPLTGRKLLIIPVIMALATYAAYDGMGGPQALPILAITVAIAVVQGVLLGMNKILDEEDGVWYVHHGKRYLGIWFSFYGLKVVLTALIVVFLGSGFHLWFGILYFLVFSTLRSAITYLRYRKLSGLPYGALARNRA